MDPTIIVAIIGAIALIIVAIITVRGARGKSKEKPKTPKEKTLKEKTLKAAEETALELLNDKRFTMRLFSTIKKRVGLNDEKELREMLVRIGAARFDGEGDDELWGLKERNPGKISPEIQKWN